MTTRPTVSAPTPAPRRARRWTATAAVAPLAVLALTSPADAAVTVIQDRAGDLQHVGQHHSGDITRVRVAHGPHALRSTVRHAPDTGVTDIYLMWVDTDPRDPGPEYRVVAGAEVGSLSVTAVDGWGRTGGVRVLCAGADVSFGFDQEPATPVTMVVPRSCLGRPARVRVSVATEPDFPFRRIDWAPGVRTFGRWVAPASAPLATTTGRTQGHGKAPLVASRP